MACGAYFCRVNDSPPILLQHRADLHLLVARWQDSATIDNLTTGYGLLQEAVRQHGVSRVLVDVRRRPVPTPAQAHWIAHVWLPQLAADCAPQRLTLAYLLSPDYEQRLNNSPGLQPSMQAVLAPDLPYELKTFIDEGTAMQWLQTA